MSNLHSLYKENIFSRATWLRDNYPKSQFKGVQDTEFEKFNLEDLRTRVIKEEDALRTDGGSGEDDADADTGFGSKHQELVKSKSKTKESLNLDFSGLNIPKKKDQQI